MSCGSLTKMNSAGPSQNLIKLFCWYLSSMPRIISNLSALGKQRVSHGSHHNKSQQSSPCSFFLMNLCELPITAYAFGPGTSSAKLYSSLFRKMYFTAQTIKIIVQINRNAIAAVSRAPNSNTQLSRCVFSQFSLRQRPKCC